MKTKRMSFNWMLSVIFALTLVLSACSGNNGRTNAPASEGKATETPSADTEATKDAEKKEPVTIKLITWSDSYQELYDKFHEKYPWITIEQVPVNGKPIMEVIASLEAAGTPADLTWIDKDMIAYDQNGLLEDLTPYIEKDPTFNEIELPDDFYDMLTWNNKKIAVPFVDVPMWVLVNKDLLAKNGVEFPANDWTYDDFKDIAKKITNPKAGEYGLTTQSDFQMRLLSTKAIADGHAANLYFMNEDLTQSLLNTPDVMNDVRWLSDFVWKDGSMQSYPQAKETGNVTKEFINGKTGFAIGGDWVLPNLKKDAKFEWDVLPFPKGKVSQPGYSIYGPLSLLSGSKHKEEAFLWISFQFSKEAQKWKIDQGANATVIDPELTAYYGQTPLWEGKNKEAVKMAKENAKIQPGDTIPAWSEYKRNDQLNKIIFDGEDINQLISETEKWNKRTLEVRESLK